MMRDSTYRFPNEDTAIGRARFFRVLVDAPITAKLWPVTPRFQLLILMEDWFIHLQDAEPNHSFKVTTSKPDEFKPRYIHNDSLNTFPEFSDSNLLVN